MSMYTNASRENWYVVWASASLTTEAKALDNSMWNVNSPRKNGWKLFLHWNEICGCELSTLGRIVTGMLCMVHVLRSSCDTGGTFPLFPTFQPMAYLKAIFLTCPACEPCSAKERTSLRMVSSESLLNVD